MSVQPIHIAFDALSGVDGSARFSFGQITALASVSGPIAARLATEHPARATVEVHVRPLSSFPGTAEKHAAIALKGIIERECILAHHPRSLIQVVVQALSPSSSSSASRSAGPEKLSRSGVDTEAYVLFAAEVNACSLALLNGGSIPLRGVVCAVAVAQSSGGRPQIVTQGGSATSKKNGIESAGCFAFLFGVDRAPAEDADDAGYDVTPRSKMIWTDYHANLGRAFSTTALEEAEKVALEGAAAVWAKMKESLA